eukprot:GGOE01062014.1.p1 GENE.GGOE01062014.1~~GGOE01062014.1.p1  ORF type:complete len:545 (+),score=114.45 GGOE01062014.1:132-1637(+)
MAPVNEQWASHLHNWLANSPGNLGQWFAQASGDERPDDLWMAEFPYFRFMPAFAGQVVPNAPALNWCNWCFQHNSAVVVKRWPGHLTVDFHIAGQLRARCSDSYFFLSSSSFRLHTFHQPGHHLVTFQHSMDTPHQFDMDMQGIRIGRLLISPSNVLKSLLRTLELFVAFGTQSVPPAVRATNLDFLAKYAGRRMPRRRTSPTLPAEWEVDSGDVFGGMRLDGLDPMLAWAMGSSTGHLTTALRLDGKLYVTESTTKDAYWPRDGIQITPWEQWVSQVQKANYHFVWLPLKPEYRQRYNVSRARSILPQFLGSPYGFHNMLWAWVDTEGDNYPCLPPSFETCLDWHLLPPLLSFMDHVSHGIAGGKLWVEAFNKRLSTVNLTTAELLMEAANRNLTLAEVAKLPEQDAWRYSDGYSRMCDAWVCTLWKASGMFGVLTDRFQCTESTNWDIVALPVFGQPRQITGQYEMSIAGLGTKPWAPYPGYAENCGGHAPSYIRTRNC